MALRGFLFSTALLIGIAPGIAVAAQADGPTYSVPSTNESQASVASFALNGVTWEVDGDRQILKYNLPDDLSGNYAIDVELEGPVGKKGFSQLQGEAATASCTQTETRALCLVTYQLVHSEYNGLHFADVSDYLN